MKKQICVIFGGVSPEHEVSLMTAHSVLNNIDRDLFEVWPVGITKAGRWFFYDGDPALLEDGSWSGPTGRSRPFSPLPQVRVWSFSGAASPGM